MAKPSGQADPATDSETRARILTAAHKVFVRRGTAAARTQEIADAACVNKALLHYYFGTKEALARDVFADAQRQLFPALFAILADPARTVDRKIRDLVDFEIDFLAARPYLPGFVATEIHTHPERITAMFGRLGRPPVAALQQQLDREHAAGRIRKLDARQFVVTVIASIVFPFVMRPVIEKFVLGPRGGSFKAFLEERRRTLADSLLSGLRP